MVPSWSSRTSTLRSPIALRWPKVFTAPPSTTRLRASVRPKARAPAETRGVQDLHDAVAGRRATGSVGGRRRFRTMGSCRATSRAHGKAGAARCSRPNSSKTSRIASCTRSPGSVPTRPSSLRPEARRRPEPKRAPAGPGVPRGDAAPTQEIELALRHQPLRAEERPVVHGTRVVHALGTCDRGAGRRAEIDETMPVAPVRGPAARPRCRGSPPRRRRRPPPRAPESPAGPSGRSGPLARPRRGRADAGGSRRCRTPGPSSSGGRGPRRRAPGAQRRPPRSAAPPPRPGGAPPAPPSRRGSEAPAAGGSPDRRGEGSGCVGGWRRAVGACPRSRAPEDGPLPAADVVAAPTPAPSARPATPRVRHGPAARDRPRGTSRRAAREGSRGEPRHGPSPRLAVGLRPAPGSRWPNGGRQRCSTPRASPSCAE